MKKILIYGFSLSAIFTLTLQIINGTSIKDEWAVVTSIVIFVVWGYLLSVLIGSIKEKIHSRSIKKIKK